MASLNTFAKLIAPPQFRPEEAVTFKLEYSQDLVDTYATLVIDGYIDRWVGSEQVPAYDYRGTKITHYVVASLGWDWDTGYEEYIVPGGTLGITPTDEQPTLNLSGKCKARVEFRMFESLDSPVIYTSNEVLVNMLVMWNRDYIFYGTPYHPDSSSFSPALQFIVRSSLGEYTANQINSYRYYLYDSEYNLIKDSGELYDWNNYIYPTNEGYYTFTGLQDDKTYYLRSKVTLNGGYTMWRGYEPVTVNYAEPPAPSQNFSAENIYNGVKLTLDLTGVAHDRVVISRTVANDNKYLELRITPNPNDTITMTDHYTIPGTRYLYRAIVFNGELVVGTYYCYDDYKNNYIVISDIYGSYVAVGNITKHPINRNDRGQEHITMDNKYPYYLINGSADYDSGQVTALFGKVENCEFDTDNREYSNILRAWLNNGKAKLLTYYTGEAWVVAISGIQTTDPDNTDVYSTTFNWLQIAEADDIKNYAKMGLVMTDG